MTDAADHAGDRAGPPQGSRRHAEDDAPSGGHGAVPAREARPAGAHARRDRAEAGELHRLLQVLARVPRLVHLHRRPQGVPRARRRRPRAEREGPGPVRDRLRPVHVLRDLRRGLPVRRALLEPRVRVRRVRHRRDDPRDGPPRVLDVLGAAAAARSRRAPRRRRRPPRDRAGVRVHRDRRDRLARRDRRGRGAQRRPRRALPAGRARCRSAITFLLLGAEFVGLGPDLRSTSARS